MECVHTSLCHAEGRGPRRDGCGWLQRDSSNRSGQLYAHDCVVSVSETVVRRAFTSQSLYFADCNFAALGLSSRDCERVRGDL